MDLSSLYKFVMYKINVIIYMFHMPLFVFVSGALFYKECHKKDVKFEDICKKKFNKLIIPYLTYGIIYNITIKFLVKFYNWKNLPYAIVYETLLGKNVIQYIWFLPTLFFVTILFFIIYNGILQKDSKKLIIFILILALFVDEINIKFPGIKYLPLLFIFFSVGILFEENREKIEKYCKNKNVVLLMVCGVMAIIFKLMNKLLFKNIVMISSFINCLMILFMILGVCFLSYILSKFTFLIENKIFELLNKYSFDIYIIGDPLNYVILFLISTLGLSFLYSSILGTMVILALRILGVLIVSVIIAMGIEKLKKLKYFKTTIKTILVASITVSMFVIMYNSMMNIEPDSYIYKVKEESSISRKII